MNVARHPRYVKDAAPSPLLVLDSDPASCEIEDSVTASGINPDKPLFTFDGDRVRLLAIDPGHVFPLVGEVVDYHAQTSWLARWSPCGIYASSSGYARSKHSLRPNNVDALYGFEPSVCPEPVVYTTKACADFEPGDLKPGRLFQTDAYVDGEGILREGVERHPYLERHPPTLKPRAVAQAVVVPKFLLKDPANDDDDESTNLIRAAKKSIAVPYAEGDPPVDVDYHFKPYLLRFGHGRLTREALVFAEAALRSANGELEVEGDVEHLTAERLEAALRILHSGVVKRVLVRLPATREAACA